MTLQKDHENLIKRAESTDINQLGHTPFNHTQLELTTIANQMSLLPTLKSLLGQVQALQTTSNTGQVQELHTTTNTEQVQALQVTSNTEQVQALQNATNTGKEQTLQTTINTGQGQLLQTTVHPSQVLQTIMISEQAESLQTSTNPAQSLILEAVVNHGVTLEAGQNREKILQSMANSGQLQLMKTAVPSENTQIISSVTENEQPDNMQISYVYATNRDTSTPQHDLSIHGSDIQQVENSTKSFAITPVLTRNNEIDSSQHPITSSAVSTHLLKAHYHTSVEVSPIKSEMPLQLSSKASPMMEEDKLNPYYIHQQSGSLINLSRPLALDNSPTITTAQSDSTTTNTGNCILGNDSLGFVYNVYLAFLS